MAILKTSIVSQNEARSSVSSKMHRAILFTYSYSDVHYHQYSNIFVCGKIGQGID